MPTAKQVAQKFATRIKHAVGRDEIYLTKGLVKKASDLASSNLGKEIIAIGQEIDDLAYSDDSPLSEEDKDQIIAETANELGWNQPKTLRKLTKGGSVDALLAMTQQLEALFSAVKK